jgi:hypothetical protein
LTPFELPRLNFSPSLVYYIQKRLGDFRQDFPLKMSHLLRAKLKTICFDFVHKFPYTLINECAGQAILVIFSNAVKTHYFG